jgi:transcriptional regulator with XRE-family HTH domain
MTTSETIGRKIARIRKQRNISQIGLQRMVPSANIWRIENDKFSPGVQVLDKIANALGATVELVPKK